VELTPGTRIDGKFEIEDLVGRGGMGYVVRARHLVLDRVVALKFLNPNLASLPEAVFRFVREARAATRITNEHVARVLDVGKLPDGDPYMVMEYLVGRDLDDLLLTTGPIRVETAVDYVLQACIALAEAHALGIIHRDLKPSNLFLTERSDGSPLVKVLDFGISKSLLIEGADGVALTQTSALIGSPAYSSPEQMRAAKSVTQASDVWSLGVILYELLTGRTPFEAPTVPELCAAVLHDEPTPLTAYSSGLPEDLGRVLMRCLEKPPERRWPTVTTLAEALVPFASASGVESFERIRGIAWKAQRPPSDPDMPPSSRRQGAPLAVAAPAAPVKRAPTEVAVTHTDFVQGGVVRRLRPQHAMFFAAAITMVGVMLVGWVVSRPSGRSAPVATRPPETVVVVASPPSSDPPATSADAPSASASAEPAPAPSATATVAASASADPARALPKVRPPARLPVPSGAPRNRRYGGRD
jgi:serine/threonine-protein kinase